MKFKTDFLNISHCAFLIGPECSVWTEGWKDRVGRVEVEVVSDKPLLVRAFPQHCWLRVLTLARIHLEKRKKKKGHYE